MPPGTPPSRFYSLDALRGIAALAVIFWHWKAFFQVGWMGGAERADQGAFPLFAILRPAYTAGWAAVDLFFCLSGFVFYWLYAEQIRRRTLSPRAFFRLRFSRLYPLHLATLLLAAAALSWFASRGLTFATPWSDAYHFVLQLFLIQTWGLQFGFSFNGPAWSISVECLLYIVFFILARYLPLRAAVLTGAVAVGAAMSSLPETSLVGRGLVGFFGGGLTYMLYQRISRSAGAAAISRVMSVLAVVLWGLVLAWLYSEPPSEFGPTTHVTLLSLTLFPLTVLALALAETVRPTPLRCIAFLGDWSYSIYLLHFPLQMLLAIAVHVGGFGLDVYYRPGVMIGFVAAVLLVSWASYRWFEMPAQRALRRVGTSAITGDAPPVASRSGVGYARAPLR